MKKVALYFVLIMGVAVAVAAAEGFARVTPARAIGATFAAVLMSYALWLRWDWAPAQRRKRQAERREEPR